MPVNAPNEHSVPRSAEPAAAGRLTAHGDQPAPPAAFDTAVPVLLLHLDANPFHHGTLGAARSLGRAGIQVHACLGSTGAPTARSRYVHRTYGPCDGDGGGPEQFAERLRRASDEIGRPAVLLPMDDLSAIGVPGLLTHLPGRFLTPAQPPWLAEEVADKERLAALCLRLGVPHPRTVVPGSAAEAGRAARELGFPAVAKWARPWLLPRPGSGRGRLASTTLLHTAEEASALYARSGEAGSSLLLQAHVPETGGCDWFFHGCFTAAGRCVAGGAGRKERAWPVRAGLTAVGRWLPHPELENTATRLAAHLGFRGVLDLDFRRDARSGAYHLLDFNPRPGAQFRLFTDGSGMDVVRALHLDLTGRDVPRGAPGYGRVFFAENYALLSGLRTLTSRGAAARAAGTTTDPQSEEDFRPSTSAPPGREAAWFAADDSAPFAAMTVAWCGHALRKGLRRASGILPRPRTTETQNGNQPCTTC